MARNAAQQAGPGDSTLEPYHTARRGGDKGAIFAGDKSAEHAE